MFLRIVFVSDYKRNSMSFAELSFTLLLPNFFNTEVKESFTKYDRKFFVGGNKCYPMEPLLNQNSSSRWRWSIIKFPIHSGRVTKNRKIQKKNKKIRKKDLENIQTWNQYESSLSKINWRFYLFKLQFSCCIQIFLL